MIDAVPSGWMFSTISAAQSCGVQAASLKMPTNGRNLSGTESGSAKWNETDWSQKTRPAGELAVSAGWAGSAPYPAGGEPYPADGAPYPAGGGPYAGGD